MKSTKHFDTSFRLAEGEIMCIDVWKNRAERNLKKKENSMTSFETPEALDQKD